MSNCYRKLLACLLLMVIFVGLFSVELDSAVLSCYVRRLEYMLEGSKGKYKSYQEANRAWVHWVENSWWTTASPIARLHYNFLVSVFNMGEEASEEAKQYTRWITEESMAYFSTEELIDIDVFSNR